MIFKYRKRTEDAPKQGRDHGSTIFGQSAFAYFPPGA